MVISAQEKEVLLKRLEKARQAKIAKKQAADAAKQAVVAEAPKIEPTPVPEPVPEPVLPAAEALPPPNLLQQEPEIKLPPKIKKTKKVVESSDDEESMEQKPNKKTKVKKTPYLKLKLYKEPTNAAAFQNLMEALHDEPAVEEPTPQPVVVRKEQSEPQPVPRVITGGPRKEQSTRPLNANRALALQFFQ
jgi:hypothetical protein